MSIQLRFRRGTTAQHSTFTGAQAEVTVDTTTNSLVVHDGVTAGGHPIASSGTLNAHVANTSNPHSVTKAQVGLGNVDNTSDANKPISTATQTALDAKVDEDLTGYTDAGALDGTEVIFANKAGAKKSTVQKILDWIKTQAITWTAKQTISGDLEFSGNARRILGDFSNATLANRVTLQTSTVDGATTVTAAPNGTGTVSSFVMLDSSDIPNARTAQIVVTPSEASFRAGRNGGAAAFNPLTFYTSGLERMRIDSAGNVGMNVTSPLDLLHINGHFRMGNGSALRFLSYNGAGIKVGEYGIGVLTGFGDSLGINNSTGTGLMSFGTNNTERLRITAAGNVEHTNFTKLGESSPAIKVKKLAGTTGAAANSVASVAHGLTQTKIISVVAYVVNNSAQSLLCPFTRDAGAQLVDVYLDSTNLNLINGPASTSNVWSKSFVAFVTYEE